MTPAALLTTTLLLGLFVLAGGGYGGLYGAGKLKENRRCLVVGYACYALQILLVVAILLTTPLAPMWKAFILLSGVGYGLIPPVTWRYLEHLHHAEESS
ncbi:MAG TPA: hypothetical protein VJ998_09980 [Pseudomonadales bacterium]|nr:hypothetical protein [Pseudomonadales bacterium]